MDTHVITSDTPVSEKAPSSNPQRAETLEMEDSSKECTLLPPNSTGQSMLQKKHLEMLDRLNARHLQQRSTSDSPAAPTTSLQSFLHHLLKAKQCIESSIELCRRKTGSQGSVLMPELKSDLENVSALIADLEKFVAESSYLLPPYEVRSALKMVSDLKQDLEKASTELLPRKKFSFRNRPAKKETVVSMQKVEEMRIDYDVSPGERSGPEVVSPPVVRESPGFRNRKSATLVKEFTSSEEREGDFSLSGLSSCNVYLMGRFRALFVNRLRNCRVFVGPVLGSILIEDVENCLLMLASHQIRIHQAKSTDFYLRVRSRPIIEYCHGVRFAPYRMHYKGIEHELQDSGLGEESGNWAKVDDFRWLRATQSPNWCVLEEKECVEIVNVSGIIESGSVDF